MFNISKRIIKDRNWKFIDPKSEKNIRDNSYGWVKLYNLARIPKHYSNTFQKYYSSYVHGLGITLMSRSDEDKLPLICSVLTLTSIIQTLIIKIFHLEYKDNLKESIIDKDILYFVNYNWENWNK